MVVGWGVGLSCEALCHRGGRRLGVFLFVNFNLVLPWVSVVGCYRKEWTRSKWRSLSMSECE